MRGVIYATFCVCGCPQISEITDLRSMNKKFINDKIFIQKYEVELSYAMLENNLYLFFLLAN